MVRSSMRMMAVAVCLVGVSCSDNAAPKVPSVDSKTSVRDSTALEGLWRGAWGGGERDGVIFQPVIAELLVQGEYVELHGFRDANGLAGTVRVDEGAKQMHITPTGDAGGQAEPNVIEFKYEIQGDRLTLIGSDTFPIILERRRTAQKPLANAHVEFVAATGVNEAGDLLVTEFTVIEAGQGRATFFEPQARSLKTKHATVLLMQEAGLKKVTLDEARGLIRESTPVVVTYRQDDRPSPDQAHELFQRMGSPRPDSDAVGQTFARLLRPGTLVFILSARENVPVP